MTLHKTYYLAICLALFSSSSLYGQYTDEYEDYFYSANILMENGLYDVALKHVGYLYAQHPENHMVNFMMGVCYLHSLYEQDKAIPYLEYATRNCVINYDGVFTDTVAPVMSLFFLGKAYHIDHRFDMAISSYNQFLDSLNQYDSTLIYETRDLIGKSEYAKKATLDSIKIDLENLGPGVNTRYPEYSSVIGPDEKTLFFTSRRPENTGEFLDEHDMPYEDIYVSEWDSANQVWGTATNMGPAMNTEIHEATISLSGDGRTMFLYQSEFDGGSILATQRNEDGTWSEPEQLGRPINSHWRDAHSSLSPDGTTLFFTSDRQMGYGGLDIWYSKIDEDGDWGTPVNLGATVNTHYDEDAPIMTKDGKTLYFSSKGHPEKNIGGFDIYKTVLQEDSSWSEPQNIGHPINTTRDDLFFYPVTDSMFYFSSVRDDGFGQLDIYKIWLGGKPGKKDKQDEEDLLASRDSADTDSTGSNTGPGGDNQLANNNTDNTNNNNNSDNNNQDIDGQGGLPDQNQNTGPGSGTVSEHTCWTVQVAAGSRIRDWKFKDLKEVKKMEGEDGMPRYVTREFSTKNEALAYEKELISRGYETWTRPCLPQQAAKFNPSVSSTGGNCFTVQVGAGNMRPNHFAPISNKLKVVDCPDGVRRYTVGEFDNMEEAKAYQEKLIKMGYAGSWARPCIANSNFGNRKLVIKEIYFDFNKSNINPHEKSELDNIVSYLKSNPEATMTIEGHTDNIGSLEYNLNLSQARAEAVYDYFIKQGVDPDRLTFRGYGFLRPAMPNNSESNRQLNRRTVFRALEPK